MYVLSIHPDGEYFKVALLSQKGKKMKIEFINDLRKDIVDLNQLKKKIDLVTRGREGSVEIVSALGPDEVFTRKLELPLKSKRGVMKALPFQLESLLPFSQEYSTTVPIIKKKQNSSLVHLYSFLNETMDEHIQNIKTFGFNPDRVSTVGKALAIFAQTFATEAKDFLIFHFGWSRCYFVAISQGEEAFSTTIGVGLKHFIDALKDELPSSEEMSLSLLEKRIENSAIEEDVKSEVGRVLHQVQRQIYRVMEFLNRDDSMKDCQGILFTGYTETLKKITRWMDGFNKEEIEIMPHLEYDTKEIAAYAIEIGMAIDCFQKGDHTVQLRVGKFISTRWLKKVKRKAKTFAMLSGLTTLMLFAGLISVHIKREIGYKERFFRIARLAGASEKSFSFLQRPFVSPSSLSSAIHQLVKGIKVAPQEKVFDEPPVLVSEMFQWILSCLTDEIKISHLNYEIVSMPTLSAMDQAYEVQVSLDFEAPSKEMAEAFVDRLKNSGGVVVSTQALIGEMDGFRADFTFKN